MGPMIIHGPTSDQYDVDAGTIMLQDWSLRTVDSMYDAAQDAITGGPRRMDNGLINGMNTWGVQGTANQTGQRFELGTKFEPGKSYLFRIINGAIQSTYKFYIDGHTLEVINMDFTNIQVSNFCQVTSLEANLFISPTRLTFSTSTSASGTWSS